MMQVYYDDDDLHGGQRSSEVKCDKLCSMATKLGQKNPWCKFMMMMAFMEVKGPGSKVVNYALWLPNLVRRIPDASLNDDDLHGGQRSSKVKWGKLCAMATIFGQKNRSHSLWPSRWLRQWARSARAARRAGASTKHKTLERWFLSRVCGVVDNTIFLQLDSEFAQCSHRPWKDDFFPGSIV